MRNIMVFTVILVHFLLSAQTVKYSEDVESYLNGLELNNLTAVNSGFTDSDSIPESFADSWNITPDYIYLKSKKNISSSMILKRLNDVFGEEYMTEYDEIQGKITKKLDRFSRDVFQNYPDEKEKESVKSYFIGNAKDLLSSIPEINNNFMFDGVAIEKSGSVNKEDRKIRITEVRVYFRRIMDGAVLSDGTIPVKIVFDAASGVIKKMEVNWIDYESVPNLGFFEKFESGSTVSNIRSSLQNGKTSVGMYGYEKFDSIYVYTVEKVWKKKMCEGGELLIPALRFFIKVRSEEGIKSIPELNASGIKETVFEPVYELMENSSCS